MFHPLYHPCNFHFPSPLSFYCCCPLDYTPFVCKVLSNPACGKEQPWHLIRLPSDGYRNMPSFTCKMETTSSGYFIHILFRSHKDVPGQKRRNTSSQNKRRLLNRFPDFFSCQTKILCWSPGKAAQTHQPSCYKISKTKVFQQAGKEQKWHSPTESRNIENKQDVLKNRVSSIRGWLTMSFSATLFQFWRSKSLADIVTAEKRKQMH